MLTDQVTLAAGEAGDRVTGLYKFYEVAHTALVESQKN